MGTVAVVGLGQTQTQAQEINPTVENTCEVKPSLLSLGFLFATEKTEGVGLFSLLR